MPTDRRILSADRRRNLFEKHKSWGPPRAGRRRSDAGSPPPPPPESHPVIDEREFWSLMAMHDHARAMDTLLSDLCWRLGEVLPLARRGAGTQVPRETALTLRAAEWILEVGRATLLKSAPEKPETHWEPWSDEAAEQIHQQLDEVVLQNALRVLETRGYRLVAPGETRPAALPTKERQL